MNKHYKLTNLLVLITLVFGSFFVWKKQTAPSNPELKVVTTAGNAEELKAIEFYGYVSSTEGYGENSSFLFKNNKPYYADDQPLRESLDSPIHLLSIHDLINDYRSFMRGKVPSVDRFISTDEWLIYTAMADEVHWKNNSRDELTIAWLNKETGEEQEFSVSLDNKESYYELYATQLNYPELSIMLTAHHDNDKMEHLIYSVDLNNPEPELTLKLDFTDFIQEDEYILVGNMVDKTSRFIPFQTNKYVEDSEFGDISKMMNYFVYDGNQNKVLEVPLFEADTYLLTDRDTIYVAEETDNQLDFYELNPETEELEAIGEIQLEFSNLGEDDLFYYDHAFSRNIAVLDGKLYTFKHQDINGSFLPVFQIVDLESQETLFFGKIDQLNSNQQNPISIEATTFNLNSQTN